MTRHPFAPLCTEVPGLAYYSSLPAAVLMQADPKPQLPAAGALAQMYGYYTPAD